MTGLPPLPSDAAPGAVSDAPTDPMIGRTIGDRYRVLGRLGEGGMGTVYLCEHLLLRRKVAVKVLRDALARDPELVERFRNEAVAASQIAQENVVDVLDLGRTADGTYFYAMEALEGRSLGALLREEGPLAVGRALGLVAQVCRALSAAHARGVVHRDLKPDNVFVVRDDDGAERAKLLDFGISRVDPLGRGERLTRAGAVIGTPEYMAPEQAAGAPVDGRADVYALGVLLHEVLTGELPILGDTPLATMIAHQTRLPDPPSARRGDVPLEVDAIVLRALAKRPDDRFESMDAFAAELLRVRAHVPAPLRLDAARRGATAVLPPTAASRPPADRGRTVALDATPPPRGASRSVIAGVLAAAFVVVAVASAWWRWAGPPGEDAPPPAPHAAAVHRAEEPAPAPAPEHVDPGLEPAPERPVPLTAAPAAPARPPPAASPPAAPRRAAGDPYAASRDLKPDPFE